MIEVRRPNMLTLRYKLIDLFSCLKSKETPTHIPLMSTDTPQKVMNPRMKLAQFSFQDVESSLQHKCSCWKYNQKTRSSVRLVAHQISELLFSLWSRSHLKLVNQKVRWGAAQSWLLGPLYFQTRRIWSYCCYCREIAALNPSGC